MPHLSARVSVLLFLACFDWQVLSAGNIPVGYDHCFSATFEGDIREHTYQIPVFAGTVIHGRVTQVGLDVETLLQNEGEQERKLDSNSGLDGEESFWLLVERGGSLSVTVRPLASQAHGYYELWFSDPLEPSPRHLMAARADTLMGHKNPLAWQQALDLGLSAHLPMVAVGSLANLAEYHLGQGDPVRAVKFLQEGLALMPVDAFPWDHLMANQLALAQHKAGQTRAARDSYQAAYAYGLQQNRAKYAGLACNDLGYLLFTLGEVHGALVWFQRAVDLYARCDCESQEAKTRINEAEVYSFLGRTKVARQRLERALSLLRKEEPGRDLALALTQLGWAAYLGDQPREALVHYEQALLLNRRLKNRGMLAGTLDRTGSALRALGRYEEALACHGEAMALFTQVGSTLDVAQARANIARDYYAQGNLERAWENCQKVLDVFRLHRPTHMSSLLALSAQIAASRGQSTLARERFEEALEVVEVLYQGSQSRGLRRSLSDTRYQILAEYAGLLVNMDLPEQAFELIDGTRARILHQRLTSAGPKQRRAPEGGALLDSYYLEKYDLDHPLGTASARKLDLEHLKKWWFDDQTLVLSFALGRRQSLLFALDREGLTVYPLPPRGQVEILAQRVHRLMAKSHLAIGRVAWAREAAKLSRILLDPVAARLGRKRLVVISDGVLHSVPLGALPDPAHPKQCLLTRHELVYIPSLRFAAALREQATDRPPAPRTLAVFADPVFNRDDPRISLSREGAELKRDIPPKAGEPLDVAYLPRLPIRETNSILAWLPQDQLMEVTGHEATREAFLNTRWADFRYLHLNTHGLLRARGELSGLVLSRYDKLGAYLGGNLQTLDLLHLDLPLELVVLSACNTAAGNVTKGEGMWGFTGAFLEAGGKRVIASLWNVRERPTAALFSVFYEYLLQDEQSPAAALRSAQLEISRRDAWQAPYYWAGWVLQGEYR